MMERKNTCEWMNEWIKKKEESMKWNVKSKDVEQGQIKTKQRMNRMIKDYIMCISEYDALCTCKRQCMKCTLHSN